MNVGLIDIDSHNFPNLALMKLSAYHKSIGHNVEILNLFNKYDLVYQSKIFTFTNDFEFFPNTKKIIKGGTGYNLTDNLKTEIENIYPDYKLYPNYKEVAYGFLTRGCPRNCLFCIVSRKEGLKSYKVADLNQFWNGQKEIKLLDPNLLACKDHLNLLQQLIDSKAYIDVSQGLDARLLTDANIDLISKLKLKMIHFAWDNLFDNDLILNNLKKFKEVTNINFRKARVYVLINFGTSENEDLERIYILKNLGYDPYVMIYEKWKATKRQKQIARWVNNKFVFRVTEKFEDYIS